MNSRLELAKATIAVHECSEEIDKLNNKLSDFDDIIISEGNENSLETEKTEINNDLTQLFIRFHKLSILENQLMSSNVQNQYQIQQTQNENTTQGANAIQEQTQSRDTPKNLHVQNHLDQTDTGNAIPRSSSRLLQLAKPPSFTAEKGDSISTFLEKFQHFITLGNIKDPNLDLYLLNLIKDPKTYRKLRSIKLSSEQKGNVNLLIQGIKSALLPDSEIRSLRSELSSLKQTADESIEDFAYRVEELSTRGFSSEELREEGALSSFLEGVKDFSLKQKLLESETANTFEKATRLAFKLDKISNTLKQQAPEEHILHISHSHSNEHTHIQNSRNQHPPLNHNMPRSQPLRDYISN